jgi:prophage DNA circulation protein
MRTFPLEAFVLGDDYMSKRDDLREAFETKGPGDLVHPYWGKLRVVVDGRVRISESPRDGGMARLSMTMVQVGDTLSPTIEPDTQAAVEDACDDVNTALEEEFDDNFSVIGYVADVLTAGVNLVNAVASDINTIKGYVNSAMAIADSIGDAITNVTDAVNDLILLPAQLASELKGVFNGIMDSIASIGDAWDSYFGDDETPGTVAGTPSTSAISGTVASGDARVDLAMKTFRDLSSFGDDLDEVSTTTTQRQQESGNQTAFVQFIKATATVEACRAIASMPFTSASKADDVRDELCDALDVLADSSTDLTYGPLVDLRAALAFHLSQITADLPSVVDYTPATTLPALVIAQYLYGDATREQEIIDRNNIRNPCRVPGGESLEVLSE